MREWQLRPACKSAVGLKFIPLKSTGPVVCVGVPTVHCYGYGWRLDYFCTPALVISLSWLRNLNSVWKLAKGPWRPYIWLM